MINELLKRDESKREERKKGLLKRLGRKWRRGRSLDVERRERATEIATSRSIRRPEAARSNARIQFPRSFNHFECARSLKLSRLPALFHSPVLESHLGSRPALASLSLRTAYHFSNGPSFLPLSDHILKNPTPTPPPYYLSSSSCYSSSPGLSLSLSPSPVPLMTYEVIKIQQGDNFSNAAYTDFP